MSMWVCSVLCCLVGSGGRAGGSSVSTRLASAGALAPRPAEGRDASGRSGKSAQADVGGVGFNGGSARPSEKMDITRSAKAVFEYETTLSGKCKVLYLNKTVVVRVCVCTLFPCSCSARVACVEWIFGSGFGFGLRASGFRFRI